MTVLRAWRLIDLNLRNFIRFAHHIGNKSRLYNCLFLFTNLSFSFLLLAENLNIFSSFFLIVTHAHHNEVICSDVQALYLLIVDAQFIVGRLYKLVFFFYWLLIPHLVQFFV